jgi:CheY-like chemotaxis protein
VTLEPPDQAGSASGSYPRTPSCRILLADSDPQRLALLAKLLRRQGYHLLTAGDGLLARGRIELEALDLVICGLEMLRLDGRELHAWARTERPDLARRFIFLVTGEITPEVERFLEEAHAWVLMPPFQEESIRSVVSEALR